MLVAPIVPSPISSIALELSSQKANSKQVDLPKDLDDRASVFLIGAGHAEGAVAGGVDDLGVIKAEAVGDGGV